MRKMNNVVIGVVGSIAAVEASQLHVRAILLNAGRALPGCSTVVKSSNNGARVDTRSSMSVCEIGRKTPLQYDAQCPVAGIIRGGNEEGFISRDDMQIVYGRVHKEDGDHGMHLVRDELGCLRLNMPKNKSEDKSKAGDPCHGLTKKSVEDLRKMAMIGNAERNEPALRAIVRELAFRSRDADTGVRSAVITALKDILAVIEAVGYEYASSVEKGQLITNLSHAARDAISERVAQSMIVDKIMHVASMAYSQAKTRC